MITSSFSLTATERVLPKLALDFTTANLDSRVTFTRTTNATNPATYTNSSGVLTLATNNQPRFDYDPVTLACKGLLIEESRTNLLLNSLIDGTTLSTQIVTTAATPYTLSFYGTGTITLSGTATDVVSGIGVYPSRKTYTFTPTAGALTCTVTGTVQFAQLEAGAFATSYIPTTTTALTRNADVATMTGTNFSDWFNQSEGAFAVNYLPYVVGGATVIQYVFDASLSGRASYLSLYKRANADVSTRFNIAKSGSADVMFANIGTFTATNNKSVCSYKLNDSAAALNGAATVTDTAVEIPTVDTFAFGSTIAATGQLNGTIQKFYYYPKLTNAEVQAFSKQG